MNNTYIKSFGIENYDSYWKARKKRGRTGITEIHSILIETARKNTRNGGRILDIGVGPGHVFRDLQKDFDTYGIEISSEAFEFYDFPKESIVKADVRDGIPFIKGVETFDTIIASHIIHHMEDPKKLVSDMQFHLAESGTIIIATPNTTFARFRLDFLLKGKFPNLSHGHKNFMTPYEFEEVIKSSGLEIIEIIKTGSHRVLREIFPYWFSGTLFFVCKKRDK